MAKIDKILGSISPLYGTASGEGLFSNMRKISPLMHLIGEGSTNNEKRAAATAAEKAKAAEAEAEKKKEAPGMKRGGAVKKMAKGGSASSRADGCATKGKTKGRMV
jgi:hypothetical protein